MMTVKEMQRQKIINGVAFQLRRMVDRVGGMSVGEIEDALMEEAAELESLLEGVEDDS